MTKFDRMNVYSGDPEPDCFGQVKGCLVAHCFWGKYCCDRAFKNDSLKTELEK